MEENIEHIKIPENYSEPTYVHLGTKIAVITPISWDYDFDPDSIFRIDPFNIFGEVITISVLVNRLGVLAAEMKSYVKRKKIDLELKEATVRKLFRQKSDKKPTIQEVDDHLISDVVIRNMRINIIKLEEDLAKIETMYDSAKDKSFKLNSLSKYLKPEDFENEIIEGSINGVLISMRDKQYSGK